MARIGRAHLDPTFKIGDDALVELSVGGHLDFVVGVAERAKEKRGFGIAGDDGWAGVASFEERGGIIEAETAFGFVRFKAVAVVAVLDEDGTDFGFEKFDGSGIGFGERG